MSEHEDMLRWWTITLITALDGFTMASMQMELVGEGKESVKVLKEGMRHMMGSYTPEQKLSLVIWLTLLSGLAVRVEPPS